MLTAFFTSASCCYNLRRQRKHTVCSCAGEACWWTIHPASKQRSEGEKVRIGDDLILVSLSSERYLVRFFVPFNVSHVCVCSADAASADPLLSTTSLLEETAMGWSDRKEAFFTVVVTRP